MKGTKRYLCLILALVMALCAFTGCGKKDPDDSTDPNNPNSGSNATELSGFVYVPEYVTIQGEYRNSFYNGVCSGEHLYVSSYEMIADNTPEGVTPEWEGQYWEYGPVIYKIAMDGSCEKINEKLLDKTLLVCVPDGDGSVLGRVCRRRDKSVLLFVIYQPLSIKTNALAHYRENPFAERFFVARELVIFPNILHKPSHCSSRPAPVKIPPGSSPPER